MDVVAVPETIQEKLGSKGANDLIWLINQIITKQRLSIEHVELRFEHLLSREIGKLRIEFKTDLSKLREKLPKIPLLYGKKWPKIPLLYGEKWPKLMFLYGKK
ncbi:hypothetical protein BMS3Abin05_02300 [bacterium BMS3Abin05]|nr:hypothetical protein BMS3Abin05_02300 [bacterium BMS3Abin05]